MKKHIYKLRVIYRDTDAEGVAYYGNYAAWTEAARSEFLRDIGFAVKKLKDERGLLFAVRKATTEYLLPAFYDDELRIETSLLSVGNASFVFCHEIYRDQVLINRSEIVIVCLGGENFRPKVMPDDLRAATLPYSLEVE
jgi:acyl-CoA thioester hydrolase